MPAVCAILVCAVGLAADGTDARLASVDTVFLPLFCVAGCAGFRFCALSAETACPASARGIAETPIFCGAVLSPVRIVPADGGRGVLCLCNVPVPPAAWTFACMGPAAVSAANSAELRTTAAPPPDTGPGLAGDVGEVPAPPERLKPDCPLWFVPAAADFPMFCTMFLATM